MTPRLPGEHPLAVEERTLPDVVPPSSSEADEPAGPSSLPIEDPIEMDGYQILLDIFVEADLDTPLDLTAAIVSLPCPGMLPSPWITWTLISLIDYGARKQWAHDMIQARLAPRLRPRSGGAVALEDERGRHVLPGLPE